MRIIPNEISVNVKSTAERRVFAQLKALPDHNGVALHSVNLPEHAYKRLGEVDFVIITPDVLLIVEVKGGSISQRDGMWHIGSRYHPLAVKAEGPFDQARSGMFELERELKQAIGDSRMAKVATGFLVITTDVDLPASTEYAPETYLGATRWSGGRGLAEALERARRFWQKRNIRADKKIPATLRDEIVKAIRPQFERVPTLATRVNELDARFELLTAEEMAFFDRFSDNPRIRCEGGAGSGKTFLAAEAARRRASEGRVLLTCASSVLSSFLQSRLNLPNITVLSFDRLASSVAEPYDLLIVDEAQDLMAFECLDVLDRRLKGGLEGGRWVFMMDPNNQRLESSSFDPDAYEHLASIPQTVLKLPHNCRNTEQIVRQTQMHTAADLGVAMAGNGIPVAFCPVDDKADEAAKLDGYLNGLQAEGVHPRDVTLVSIDGGWDATSARLSARFSRMVRLAHVTGVDPQPDRTSWASVDEVKGLENRFVCIVDLDEQSLQGRLDALYVAMTRPRAGLWIACQPGTLTALKKIGAANFKKRVEDKA
ncbi:NERD domain-containing protein [Streptosporangium sp. NPDC049078]|uniref:nuclease-related domain-containing DEAD/DEAH box helicase n=1 Tax=Streptosporangium sp. NPDC049078 TaxID=3155767 RepID=UPI00343C3119